MAGRLIVTVGDEAQPTMETFVIRRIGESDWLEQSIFDTHIPSLMKQEKTSSDSSFVFWARRALQPQGIAGLLPLPITRHTRRKRLSQS